MSVPRAWRASALQAVAVAGFHAELAAMNVENDIAAIRIIGSRR
jgi:hypothetical protein